MSLFLLRWCDKCYIDLSSTCIISQIFPWRMVLFFLWQIEQTRNAKPKHIFARSSYLVLCFTLDSFLLIWFWLYFFQFLYSCNSYLFLYFLLFLLTFYGILLLLYFLFIQSHYLFFISLLLSILLPSSTTVFCFYSYQCSLDIPDFFIFSFLFRYYFNFVEVLQFSSLLIFYCITFFIFLLFSFILYSFLLLLLIDNFFFSLSIL